MYTLEWRTVSALTRGLFWCLFPEFRSNGEINTKITLEWAQKQFITRVYIILFLTRHDESTNYDKTTIFTHRHRVSPALGPDSIQRCHLISIGNPIVEIRRSCDRLICTMGFPIPVRRHLYIESGPCSNSGDDVIIDCWWRHNYQTIVTWIMIFNSLDRSILFTVIFSADRVRSGTSISHLSYLM